MDIRLLGFLTGSASLMCVLLALSGYAAFIYIGAFMTGIAVSCAINRG